MGLQSLHQRHLWTHRHIALRPSSVVYEIKTQGQSQAYDISFEHIYKVVLTDQQARPGYLWLGMMSLFLSALTYLDTGGLVGWPWVFMVLSGFLLLLLYRWSKVTFTKVKLSDNQYLHFYQNAPDKATVQRFLVELFKQRDAYLIEEYGTVNTRLSYNYQLEQFKRLRRLQVWTQAEFEAKCQRLESMHRLMDMGFDFDSKISQN